jgi:prepilin-type N-terminal cleavage/methylation domain-containing protein
MREKIKISPTTESVPVSTALRSVPACSPVTHHASRITHHAAFTLIELILVMAILTIAVSITAPALSNFFHGRSLDSEARRLLSLTRQGQSRAVSEGLPIELWVDSSRNVYGLEADSSYEMNDTKAVSFNLDKDVQLQAVSVDPNAIMNPSAQEPTSTEQNSANLNTSKHSSLPRIRFLPDGSVSEISPQVLRLTGRDGALLEVALSRSHLNYEIRAQKTR